MADEIEIYRRTDLGWLRRYHWHAAGVQGWAATRRSAMREAESQLRLRAMYERLGERVYPEEVRDDG